MTKTVVIAGAFDTKGAEFAFVNDLIRAHGLATLLVDFGVLGDSPICADISNVNVANEGGADLARLRDAKDKAEAMRVMTAGLTTTTQRLHANGQLQGMLSMGGTGGTAIAAAAMRTLPVGVPKVMVSTVGGGDISAYIGGRDIVIIPSVVDVAGINRISRKIYANAAGAICGMIMNKVDESAADRPLIAASMFGNTTECLDRSRATLEKHGFEVLVFHATGAGGRTMKSLIEDGFITGIFDITTTELADEVCGGVFSAGPERVHIASSHKTPLVLAPGCVDMCNFGARATVPSHYQSRTLYEWNPNVTLMRTDVEENRKIGELLAATANLAKGPVTVLLPLGGVSMLDSPGGPFWNPEANQACFETIKRNLRSDILCKEVDANINDPMFADRATETMLRMTDKTV